MRMPVCHWRHQKVVKPRWLRETKVHKKRKNALAKRTFSPLGRSYGAEMEEMCILQFSPHEGGSSKRDSGPERGRWVPESALSATNLGHMSSGLILGAFHPLKFRFLCTLGSLHVLVKICS